MNTEGQKGSYKYWLTLEQWRQDPEFQKLASEEFASSPLREADSSEGGWARREFLKLMGASLALTSFGCVRRPAQKIVPYAKRPKDVINGIPNFYASSFHDGGEAFGILVRTREGRPIKVEGNNLHAVNEGALSPRAGAHILSLYDPDRLNAPLRNLLNETRTNRDTVKVTYDVADEDIAKHLKKGQWAILTGSLMGPTQKKLVGEFVSAFGGQHYVWEPLSAEVMRKGQEVVFGRGGVPRLRLDQAKYVLAVDADILGTYLAPTEAQKQFGQGRRNLDDGGMNKLVVAESLMTLTGMNADERFRLRPSQAADFLSGLLYQLIVKKKRAMASSGAAILALQDYANVHEELGLTGEQMETIADDLWSNRGKSLVVAGEDLRAQVAANILNAILGNDGKTVDYGVSPHVGYQGTTADLKKLVDGINSGKIKRLFIHGVNPVYSAPQGLRLLEALQKLEFAVYTGDRQDETGLYCDYVLPDHHPMENWGDLESQGGIVSLQQPTIRPLGETRAFEDTLINVAKAASISRFDNYESWYDYLRAAWKPRLSGDFESAWMQLLEDGVANKTLKTGTSASRTPSTSAFNLLKRQKTPRADFELVLYPTIGLRDGTYANVSWLQEFPDPVTKICWDNYLCVSPKTAKDRKLQEGQVVELDVAGTKVKVPTHIQPGQDDHTLGLALGYGRTAAGEVANNVGVNAYTLAQLEGDYTQYVGLTATMKPTMTSMPLACTAGHNSMEGRQIVVEATLDQYKKNPGANIHRHKMFSAWSERKYESYKWGMTLDLNLCTGCSACVIACQSENNVPTVGKRYVAYGREMHWLRIDRYYIGNPDNPAAVTIPVPCQHCDNAPCETVCPVAATVHSPEGTNDMIYNRCVGTRYCSNNCPYKVRRFNWFNYATIKSPLNLALNPEVSVRSRGVMEKCTFCIHKIHQAKTQANLEDRKVKDGEIATACELACPTKAIVFGDMNNPESRVAKIMKNERAYSLLEELNTKPAVRYLSKIRNTDVLVGRPHGHEEPAAVEPQHEGQHQEEKDGHA